MPFGEGEHTGNIGIMEKKIETTIVYWACMVMMEKKKETSIVYCGCIRILQKI